MFCGKCGADIKNPEAKHCPTCGTALGEERVVYCQKCGTKQDGSNTYCEECGALLKLAAVEMPAPMPVAVSSSVEESTSCENPISVGQSTYAGQSTPVEQGASAVQIDRETPSSPAQAQSQPQKLSWEWEASAGSTVAGFVTCYAVSGLFSVMIYSSNASIVLCGSVLLLLLCAFQLGWTMFWYPSLFDEKPSVNSNLLSSGSISFLNGLFGGIFGFLWNECLNKAKLGISQAFIGLVAGIGLFLCVFACAAAALMM